MNYDPDNWVFYGNTRLSSTSSTSGWPVLSNGTVAVVPCLDAFSSATGQYSTTYSAGITASASVLGSPSGRPIDFFNFMRIRLYLVNEDGSRTQLVQRALEVENIDNMFGVDMMMDMKTGVFAWIFMNPEDPLSSYNVMHEVRALMHLPGVVLHTVSVYYPDQVTDTTFEIVHEVTEPASSRASSSTTVFSGDTIAPSSGGESIFFMTALDPSTGASCVSTYLPFVDGTSVNVLSRGYNVSASKKTGWGSTRLLIPSNTNSFNFAVLTASSMARTPAESQRTVEMSKRRLLNLLGPSPSDSVPLFIQSLHEAHAAAWAQKWAASVDVLSDTTDLTPVRRALRYAMYNVLSCCHRGLSVDLAGTTLDRGARAHDALGNLLVLFGPSTSARGLLESRWRELASAQDVAEKTLVALDGGDSKAVLFPYDEVYGVDPNDDTEQFGAGDALWQGGGATSSGIAVMGTLGAAIDAWNAFRAGGGDLSWLAERGFPIIRAAADLVAQGLVIYYEDDDLYLLPNVVGIDTARMSTTNPVLVVVASVAVLRAACEAAYALGNAPSNLKTWENLRYSLSVSILSNGVQSQVTLAPSSTESGDDASTLRLAIPEPLVALLEPYVSLGSVAISSVFDPSDALDTNIWFWSDPTHRASTPAPGQAAFGDLVIAQALARASQKDPSRSSDFLAALESILETHTDAFSGGFGNFRANSSTSTAQYNDLGLSAQLLTVFVQGLAGAFVQGGYTPAQDVYATLGVSVAASAVLPTDWERLLVSGIGHEQVDAVLLNGGLNPSSDPSSFIPWTVNSLM